ncbi:adk [Symbiodinium pilosum]|uniref:Adk protein n=1 Tax=Symbiodinium pilosum TaxID=2952 RepID=A0A812VEG7_SYMPI|nr:adk [Symbiodinium pilosum]
MAKEAKVEFLTRLIQEATGFLKDAVAPGTSKPSVQGLSDSEEEGPEPLKLTAQDILSGRQAVDVTKG